MCKVKIRGRSATMSIKNNRTTIKSGFADGFCSPFLVFGRKATRFSYRKSDTIKDAWRVVGQEVELATRIEGRRIDKIPRSKEREFAVN